MTDMATMQIETARLLLRAPSGDDLAWTLAHMNTAAVMRHLGGVREEADAVAGFERNARNLTEIGAGFWTVVLRESGERVGKCGLAPIDTPHAPVVLRDGLQVGWSLAEPYWGRGFACEAAQAVLDWGFSARGLDTIWSQTSASNQASTRLMARLGLERMAALDYVDPDYPAEDNPTTVYRALRAVPA
jgi:RimJ/RimL family protein N-acetyltransferase